MKYKFTLFCICLMQLTHAQVTINNGTLLVQNGAILTVDSLTFLPTADFNITNNTITHTATSVAIGANQSIPVLYAFNDPVTFTGTAILRYNPNNLAGNAEHTLWIITKTSNAQANWATPATVSTLNTSDKTLTQVFNAGSIYRLTAISDAAPLPLHLLHFMATKQTKPNQSLLEWQLARSEVGGEFEIQRSGDGQDFLKIGQLASSTVLSYQFTDSQPITGKNFYRLKITDAEQQSYYSPIRLVSFDNDKMASTVFPNPAQQEINLRIGDPKLTGSKVYVWDASGKMIYQCSIVQDITTIKVASWVAGTYFLVLANGERFQLQKLQ